VRAGKLSTQVFCGRESGHILLVVSRERSIAVVAPSRLGLYRFFSVS